jgi:hypothetical protein
LHIDVVQNPPFYKVGFVVSGTLACYAYRYMDNQIQAPESGVESSSVTMPGSAALVSESFTKSLTSWPLFILLAGTGAVMSVVSYLLEFVTTFGVGEVLALTLVLLIAVVANLLATIVAIKYFMNDGAGDIVGYFKESLTSAWSYIWVMIISMLVMFSAFMLFIIPGLILSTYLMFALYARVNESATGMNALVRSTELVRGYWWAVTGRMVLLTIAVIGAFLLAGISLGFLAAVGGLSESTIHMLSLLAFEPIFSALGTIICLYALTVIYKALVAAKAGVVSEPSSVRGWYIGLAILSPFLFAGVFALLVLGFMFESGFVDPALESQILLEMETGV